ncbi:transmembrane protein [Aerosticca soli]|uniref:Transmembrane protein n=2 Tax=Aerosticca soli TaxID=2010829 RepID=A0A2Z6E642_9GAMM|nr:transmembrane protein [Aerosticca soli]
MAMAEFRSFREFYPYYLGEHRHPVCRRLHLLGSTLVLAVVLVAILTADWRWLLLAPVVGYGFAWIGHFVFEKNRPATFRHPLYSLLGDWVMYWQVLTGRRRP